MNVKFNEENIPTDLKNQEQWFVWKLEERNEKTTKKPYNARTGGPGKTNDPRTFSSFSTAKKAAQNGKYNGVGFAFKKHDGLFGIDLDHCIDKEGNLNPQAERIVDHFKGTYCEISPSGRGLRIFGYGEPERCGKGKSEKWVEVYDYRSPRYLTVTGRHLEGTATTLSICQDPLTWLHKTYFKTTPQKKPTKHLEADEQQPSPRSSTISLSNSEVIEKASKAKNGAKFSSLFAGDWSGYGYESQNEADSALCSILAFWTQGDPQQIDQIFQSSGLMRKKWNKVHHSNGATYGQETISRAIKSCHQFYRPKQKRQKSKKTTPAPPSPPNNQKPLTAEEARLMFNPGRTTHQGNAERLVERFGSNLHFVKEWGWLAWNGQKWLMDRGEEEKLYKKIVKGIFLEAAQEQDSNRREALWKWAKLSESQNVMAGTLRMAQSEPGIRAFTGDFDKNSWLLNLQNGTVELRTGQLLPHTREHLITKQVPITHKPKAICPTFQAYLQRIFEGDQTMIEFIQRAVGYSLTANTREHCIFILYGTGRNGKSTLINVLNSLLGEFAKSVEPEVLTIRQRNQANTLLEIADLAGARLVTAVETEDNKRLAEAKIKQMSGGDWMKGRFLYKEPFDFLPVWKLWYATNHKPTIRGTDEGIWSRIRLIPFEVFIPQKERDLDLGEKLQAELSGILNWAIEGCLKWQKEGLQPPKKVEQATAEYRAEQDIFSEFVSECCMIGPRATATAKDLYDVYCSWCDESGLPKEKQHQFGRRLAEKGFEKRKKGRIYWKGLGILAERLEKSGPFGPSGPRSRKVPLANSRVETFQENGPNGPEGPQKNEKGER